MFAYTHSPTIVGQIGCKRGVGNQSYPRSRIFFGHSLARSIFIRNTSFIVADEVSLQHARLRNSNFVFKDESTCVIMYGEHVQRMQRRVPEAKLRWNRRNFVFTIPLAFAVKLPLSVNIKARRPPPWIVTKILRIQLSWEKWGRGWGRVVTSMKLKGRQQIRKREREDNENGRFSANYVGTLKAVPL